VARMDEAGWKSISTKAYETAARYTWDDASARFEAALFTHRRLQEVPE